MLRRFSINLEKSRELEIDIYWRDWRSLCAVKFLRLEEFIDDMRHGMALQLEPKGLLFAEIKFLNPMITRKPKLRRQRKIFRQQGKMPRPDQMNINVATWGRLLKRNLNFQKSVGPGGGSADTNNHAKDSAAASNMHHESSSASRQDNTSATGECYMLCSLSQILKSYTHIFRVWSAASAILILNNLSNPSPLKLFILNICLLNEEESVFNLNCC